ncbi:sensor histidine kinase [Methanospirillum stamsii]|uniref:Histidine kinase domain-containing protein n=1 Tax=Methanospirillum stamsii TaxID=1277351 RepID=A0A2V2NCF6_9EURY|nr:HAMP domain-containing sensor histidine kinase [Methanospirillum stamsii]PWR75286.1 hypothetical protein DLD82_05745 [Methanospirillum stamsii]
MTFETSTGELSDSAPVVVFERNPDDIWKIRNISRNHILHGILINYSGHETDYLSDVFPDDQNLVSRKLGAAILQYKDSVQLRYRLKTSSSFRWIEEHCSLSYSETGALLKATSYLWMSVLPVEWALLSKGSETWNTLNSKVRHDILNQLTAILGYLELSGDLISDPMLIEFTKKEQNAAEKIRDRLIFTREYQKIGLYEFSWVPIDDAIHESLNEIVLNPINLSINCNNAALFVDKNFYLALGKIFMNIPEHAKGATIVTVSFSALESGGILVIEDNGCGIPEQQKNRIFDLGFGSGSGYGLFLAEKLLSVFGITICEKGLPGQGARFELSIPSSILNIRALD